MTEAKYFHVPSGGWSAFYPGGVVEHIHISRKPQRLFYSCESLPEVLFKSQLKSQSKQYAVTALEYINTLAAFSKEIETLKQQEVAS